MSSSSTSIGLFRWNWRRCLLEQVCIVLVEVSAPVFVAVSVAGHRALLWLSPAW